MAAGSVDESEKSRGLLNAKLQRPPSYRVSTGRYESLPGRFILKPGHDKSQITSESFVFIISINR